MLYYLVTLIPGYAGTPLRLFDYVTFRAGAALITSLFLGILFGPLTVRLLKKLRATAPTRLAGLIDEKLIDHAKDSTPSMGGLLVVGSIVVSALLWSRLNNRLLLIFLGTLVLFSALGFWDDFMKVAYRKRDGISGKLKLLFQALISFGALFLVSRTPELGDTFRELCVPFVKNAVWIMPPVVAFIFLHARRRGHKQCGESDGREGRSGGRLHDLLHPDLRRVRLYGQSQDFCGTP